MRSFTEQLLDALPPPGEPVTIAAVAAQIGADNRRVVQAMDVLRRRGLVERIGQTSGFYILTKAGLDFRKQGKQIKSGPGGPHTGRRSGAGGLRAALWAALRLSDQAVTLNELLSLIDPALHGKAAESNGRRYLRQLAAAGYVFPLTKREPGTALTSNGFRRFRFIKNTGPQPPYWSPKHGQLIDPNLPLDVPIVGTPPRGNTKRGTP